MRHWMIKIAIALFTLSLVCIPQNANAESNNRIQTKSVSAKELKLHDNMRKLWIEHAVYTRDYIKSALAGLEDQEVVLARLLKNQKDIGNAIKPFYGKAAGDQLGQLLTDHIVIAGKLVAAIKSNDQVSMTKFNKEWYKNADDITAFLSKANPYWKKDEIKNMLYMHLQQVSDVVSARFKKDWNADIKAFDHGTAHLIQFADVLSKGIMKQFPQKF
ncbi:MULTISPECIES: glycosyltransferase [unclassified Bacillus (in: firmicutes)]|uniref:glycosyltransferase n=1 Tax=unclassified Bacillus (in: firmicutes) TaxID=185979 RepID=UPI0008E678A6|nr:MULTISPECIES: glycosyltransferase [unclassified Bacillus (in: firmicutes)]SFA69543.1 hypothetical protein SAMN02799634_10130 [Bacillus sp. UNCCL13]SFQ58854.1 hypothetical protein SAMN04488577_0314 [Bacillus sp. cl95]